MVAARSFGRIGLVALGVWLVAAAPVRASEPAREAVTTPSPSGTGNVGDDCTYKGIKLAGKVQIVESFPDIRVKAVASFPDLKVEQVGSFADQCGEWQFVDSFPDFKIQYVDSFPDIEIAWVDSFPGLP